MSQAVRFTRNLNLRAVASDAHQLFDKIPQRDLSTLNALLSTHVRRDDVERAWSLFVELHRSRSDFDAYTLTPLLKACSALCDPQRGRQVHGLVVKTGSECEVVTKTALVDMYSKCGQLGDSAIAFEEMGIKDVVAWNTMISCYARHGFPERALMVFDAMQRRRVEFSEVTLSSVLKACGALKGVQLGRQVHTLVVAMGRDLLVLGTNLVSFYSDCALMGEARKVFNCLNCGKDDAIYNALVSGYVQSRSCSDVLKGKEIHGLAIRFGFDLDTQLSNALLNMYSKCGKGSTARSLFDRMPQKNVVSWTSVIDAYGSQGCGVEALELFEKMKESHCLPNATTFLTVLSACVHSGLVKEGQECFVSMKEKHGLDPSEEHYACLIDLLGRAGLMEQVWNAFDSASEAGVAQNGGMFAALLNACRVNMDIQRGEHVVGKLLFKSKMENPGNWVAISNFFASIGRWDQVKDLRNLMYEKGLQKVAGIIILCCRLWRRKGCRRSLKQVSQVSDSNVIIPGTEFVAAFSIALHYFIHHRLNHDPRWKQPGQVARMARASVKFLNIWELREYLVTEMRIPNSPFEIDLEDNIHFFNLIVS
ncbi:hypothetical protein Sjap_016955 [Stephania japonica]|uniref:Xrn1 N-terminal domain-containing protein n=1 Tax=Stephania japonica TaxID=461633 RepID=A0AAP0NJS7_9MAGN